MCDVTIEKINKLNKDMYCALIILCTQAFCVLMPWQPDTILHADNADNKQTYSSYCGCGDVIMTAVL